MPGEAISPMRGDHGSDRRAHLIEANRLIKAFIEIEDSESRQKVIELAERLTKKVDGSREPPS